MSKTTQITDILESFWPPNKAKGLYAQTRLIDDGKSGAFGRDASEKLFGGCWFFAPKGPDFYKFRFSFFVDPIVRKTGSSVGHPKELLGEKYRPFHAIAEFLKNTGIGVVYVVTSTADGQLPLEMIKNRHMKI